MFDKLTRFEALGKGAQHRPGAQSFKHGSAHLEQALGQGQYIVRGGRIGIQIQKRALSPDGLGHFGIAAHRSQQDRREAQKMFASHAETLENSALLRCCFPLR